MTENDHFGKVYIYAHALCFQILRKLLHGVHHVSNERPPGRERDFRSHFLSIRHKPQYGANGVDYIGSGCTGLETETYGRASERSLERAQGYGSYGRHRVRSVARRFRVDYVTLPHETWFAALLVACVKHYVRTALQKLRYSVAVGVVYRRLHLVIVEHA